MTEGRFLLTKKEKNWFFKKSKNRPSIKNDLLQYLPAPIEITVPTSMLSVHKSNLHSQKKKKGVQIV